MIKLNFPKFWSSKNILSSILIPFSYIYKFLGHGRKIVTKQVRLPGFVICVGNMSVGGTGKTQFVIWLSKHLLEQNHSFLIVTKGYKSKLKGAKQISATDTAADVGDESVLLRKYGSVVAAKSIKQVLPIIENLKPQIIIFDDGMQNPGFVKDLVVLMIDAKRHTGNGRIFPAGPLRQDVRGAAGQADIIVTVGNKPCPNILLKEEIDNSFKPSFEAKIDLVSNTENNIDISKTYYAFTAIGDPGRFFNLLEENGVNLVGRRSYPDHYHYAPHDIKMLKQEAKKHNCLLITTSKDYVKIQDNANIICAEVDLNFSKGQELLHLIYEKIKTHS